jgi:hypothetical protein
MKQKLENVFNITYKGNLLVKNWLHNRHTYKGAMTMSDPHSDGGMSRALDISGGGYGSNFISGEPASQDEFFDYDATSRDYNSVS